MKNNFYFILKALFLFLFSRYLDIFVLTFWSGKKENGLRLISKFITSQPSQQTITIHLLSKSHEVLGNEIWSTWFTKNHAGNEAEGLVPDLFLFF